MDKCPIWQTPARVTLFNDKDSFRVNSPRAGGTYIISGTAVATVGGYSTDQRISLTSWLVRQRMMGNDEPMIYSYLDLSSSHLEVHQRADNLLKYIDSQLPRISDVFEFRLHRRYNPETDYYLWKRYVEMLAWSESTKLEELEYLLTFLEREAWLEKAYGGAVDRNFQLTMGGHSHLAEFNYQSVDSTQAFVAMWFDMSLDDAWKKGIAPAIRESGYTELRIDKKEHANKIDDEIIAEIRRSKFLIADLTEGDTGARGSVYYEVGFAHGLGIPAIFTCREGLLEKIHFDIRQYSVIEWSTPKELRLALAKRISAVIGDGPLGEKP